jgi:hypothetical protein
MVVLSTPAIILFIRTGADKYDAVESDARSAHAQLSAALASQQMNEPPWPS